MMTKPDNYEAKKFFSEGKIKTISVDYVQTGSESAETRITFTLLNDNARTFTGRGCMSLIELNMDWCSVGKIKQIYYDEIKEWEKFECDNELELKEYKRLKAKFGNI